MKNSDASVKGKRVSFFELAKYLIFLAFGLFLFWWLYRGHNLAEIETSLKEFNYNWIALYLFIALLSHVLRAMRWRMLLQSIAFKPGLLNTVFSILIMYLANFAVPRIGEIVRCGVIRKYEGIPVSEQLGTVVVERLIDLLLLSLLLVVVFIFQGDVLGSLFNTGGSSSLEAVTDILNNGMLYIVLAIVLLLSVILFLLHRKKKGVFLKGRLITLWQKFIVGIGAIRKLKNPAGFYLLSVLIYFGYFLMTFVVFKAYEPTENLNMLVGLSVFVMGSVGMVVPVQGGIGTYHYFVIQTLLLYGIDEPGSQVFALVIHGSMTLFMILSGLVALLLLPIVNRRNDKSLRPKGQLV